MEAYAFLHGDLTREVEMREPLSFEQCDSNVNVLVCKLHKALYGLKQAPRAWFEKLKHFLFVQLLFLVSQSDN